MLVFTVKERCVLDCRGAVSLNTRITYPSVEVNQGGAYSGQTSIFTCPDSGLYVFHASVLSRAGGGTYFAIVQNNEKKGMASPEAETE